MSIQSVSFGKTITTKNGNEYKKTHAATITGAAVGAGLGTINSSRFVNSMAGKREIAKIYSALKETMSKTEAKRFTKYSAIPGSIAAGAALTGTIGLGLGALVNKAINHHKAKVADKKAAAAEAQA